MPKVLCVDDDELVLDEIVGALPTPDYTVEVAHSGRTGLAKVMAGNYDVITLDRMLPDLDGLTILTTVRDVGIQTPVLVLSSMSEVDDRVRGLRAGGDDYLTKPFAGEELLARIEVLLRHHPTPQSAETVLRAADLELDLIKRKASVSGKDLPLQATEFRVLEFLMRHPGQILTRTMIFEGVWGCRFDPGTNLIDVHVGRLRKKVESLCSQPMIRTIRGSGYLFNS